MSWLIKIYLTNMKIKKISNFLVIILTIFFVSGCAKKPINKLTIPPNYAELPNLDEINQDNKNSDSRDLKPIKEILLN